MEIIPVKTSIMQPPQDDLWSVLDACVTDLNEGDVLMVSSKVVAIHEGNCVPVAGTDKAALVRAAADHCIDRPYWGSPLTIIKNTFIGNAGIDESNANGYYVQLPVDCFLSAESIYRYLQERFALEKFGVIITDSHSAPLRRGASGVAIGWWGISPIIDHVGEPDLFGREMKIEVTNLADSLAAAATVVMGEVAQCQPLAIIRGVPGLNFSLLNTKDELFVELANDTFRVLYEDKLETS